MSGSKSVSPEAAADTLRAIATRWMVEVWCEHQLDIFEDLHARNFTDHSPAGRDPTLEGFRLGVVELFTAFPDFEAVIDDLVIDKAAGKVAIRWSATGTHSGIYLGLPATGRRIHFSGIEIISIARGRVRERWGEWDSLALLEQLAE